MFKKLILAVVLTAGGTLVAGSTAVAGHPHCGNGYGGGGGYYSNYGPVYRSHRQSYFTPYYGQSQGYGYSGYNTYRPAIGINIGGSPFGYGSGFGGYGSGFGGYGSGFGGYGSGFGSNRGGSGFSMYLGR